MKVSNKTGIILIIAAIAAAAALYGFFYFSLNDFGAYPFLSVKK